MFSYSVDVELEDLAPLLRHIVDNVFDGASADDAEQLVEELESLPSGERLAITVEDDEEDPLRVGLVLERSGPLGCTLVVLSNDEEVLAEIATATRRFLNGANADDREN